MILERKQERKSKCLWLKSGKNRKDLFSRRMWRELELEDSSGVYEFHMMNRNVSLSCRILRGHTFWKMILNCNVDPQCSTAILNLSFFQRGLYCWAAAPRNSFQVSRHLKLALMFLGSRTKGDTSFSRRQICLETAVRAHFLQLPLRGIKLGTTRVGV